MSCSRSLSAAASSRSVSSSTVFCGVFDSNDLIVLSVTRPRIFWTSCATDN
jgi:hypothetical protein